MRWLALYILLSLTSCLSYLPPSSLHVDMLPSRHALLKDSLQNESQLLDLQAYAHRGYYHHKSDPEIEDNKGFTGILGYSFAERHHSIAIGSAYSLGDMIDNDGNRYKYSNLMLRSSFSVDQHDGKWHYNLLKFQMAASKGFGSYQRFLALGADKCDSYNLAVLPDSWYYSLGIGSAMYHYSYNGQRSGMYFGYARGTDFDQEGFRSDIFSLQLEYLRAKGLGFQLGGMLDARFSPGGETVYLGLSYDLLNR